MKPRYVVTCTVQVVYPTEVEAMTAARRLADEHGRTMTVLIERRTPNGNRYRERLTRVKPRSR